MDVLTEQAPAALIEPVVAVEVVIPEQRTEEGIALTPEQFAADYQNHFESLAGYARHLTGNSHLAEELVQDFFVAHWRLGRQRTGFVSYARTSILRGAMDHFKTARRRNTYPTDDMRPHAPLIPESDAAVIFERTTGLLGLLGTIQTHLSGRAREIFLERFLLGAEVDALATNYNITPRAVSQSLSRSRRTLRAALASTQLMVEVKE